jgi:hypothetical protein
MKPRVSLGVTSCPNRELNGTRPSVPNKVIFNFILLEICRLLLLLIIIILLLLHLMFVYLHADLAA